ncbi:Protein of unknown function [Bacillus wiedmannii]|uniref:Uncharacterized protein n=1 Tax=Bacillus wiedmannii TaxID=1890302 RepID=A0A1C4AJY3_9BACI|nr:Protein of unknown function [Bacillus wiedmannii]
MYNSYHTE